MPVLLASGTGGQGIVSERLTHDTLRFRGCRDELSLQRNASRRSVEKDQRGEPCLTRLGERIMVEVRARERQLALRRRQSHVRPHRHRAIRSARGQGHAHIHAAALPRSTPAEPTLAISDCEAAPAGSTARAPARRLRCRALTRRVSGNQVTGGSRAHVANCTHAQGSSAGLRLSPGRPTAA